MYVITIEKMTSEYSPETKPEVIQNEAFMSISDAKKCIKRLMKQFGLIRHAGHIVNYSDQVELHTNF